MELTRETRALLALLALGQRDYDAGKHTAAEDFFSEMDKEMLGPDADENSSNPVPSIT
jgi:hypothetical protein